jgi:hypothetical protein
MEQRIREISTVFEVDYNTLHRKITRKLCCEDSIEYDDNIIHVCNNGPIKYDKEVVDVHAVIIMMEWNYNYEKMIKFIKTIPINSKIEEDYWEPHVNLLQVACRYGKPEIVSFLIENGIDIHHKDINGTKSLNTAVILCHMECLKILLPYYEVEDIKDAIKEWHDVESVIWEWGKPDKIYFECLDLLNETLNQK